MKEILIFYGPIKAFSSRVKDFKNKALSIYEILETLKEENKSNIIAQDYNSIIFYTSDYSSLSESGEKSLVLILKYYMDNKDIDNIFLQNPTDVFRENLLRIFDKNLYDIKIIKYQYPLITKENLLGFYYEFLDNIIGQNNVREQILISLYSLYRERNYEKPMVLMFYGPSGVGKTQTAKFISELLGGNLLRLQMSMYQNSNSLNYLFGEKHYANSFAIDLLERKSNVVLLDEFDKTFDTIYSAFYQAFDEGIFKDSNYSIELKNTIFICTSNYNSKNDIRKKLGDPMYYRFNKFIKFDFLTIEDIKNIIKKAYKEIHLTLDDKEMKGIEKIDIIELFNNEIEDLIKNDNINYRYIENTMTEIIDKILVNNFLKANL